MLQKMRLDSISKAHLDALAFIPRLKEALCPHESSRPIAGVFVNVTGYLSSSHNSGSIVL
jgi:hypothetical protein